MHEPSCVSNPNHYKSIFKILRKAAALRQRPPLPPCPPIMNEPDNLSIVSKPMPDKLEGAKNYRSWTKDMEIVMLQMKA